MFVIKGKLYFGEITLYPGSGFLNKKNYDADLMIGNKIKLPSDRNNIKE